MTFGTTNKALFYNYEPLAYDYYMNNFKDTPFYDELAHLCNEYKYIEGGHPILNWLKTSFLHAKSKEHVASTYGRNGYLKHPSFDPDCCEESFAKLISLSLRDDVLIDATINKTRQATFHIGENILKVESDTLNSFWTTYKNALQLCYPDDFKNLTRNSKWIKILIEEFHKHPLVNDNSAIMEFSYLTHTLPNFGFVPKGFNRYRYNISKDYWDISLQYLLDANGKNTAEESTISDNYKEFCKHLDLFSLVTCIYIDSSDDIKAIPYSTKYTSKIDFNDFSDLLECVIQINTMIKTRAEYIEDNRNFHPQLFSFDTEMGKDHKSLIELELQLHHLKLDPEAMEELKNSSLYKFFDDSDLK